jgi:hypothetical protein
VNAEHSLVARLAELWTIDAEAAAYALAKVACLADGIHPRLEDRLLAAHLVDTRPAADMRAFEGDLAECMRTVIGANELLEGNVEIETLGGSGDIAVFKGMRVVLNAAHPYLKGAPRGASTTFRLASAVYTCFNRALDRIRDEHEIAFLQSLADWRLGREPGKAS